MFYEIVNNLCKERKTTITQMAVEIGLSNAAPTSWRKGSVPKLSTLEKISSYFDVSTDFLLGKEENKKTASQTGSGDEKEKAVTSNGDGLSEYHKQLVELAMQCPDDQAPAMLQAMQLFLQNWSK